jgi:hypothetical protein
MLREIITFELMPIIEAVVRADSRRDEAVE